MNLRNEEEQKNTISSTKHEIYFTHIGCQRARLFKLKRFIKSKLNSPIAEQQLNALSECFKCYWLWWWLCRFNKAFFFALCLRSQVLYSIRCVCAFFSVHFSSFSSFSLCLAPLCISFWLLACSWHTATHRLNNKCFMYTIFIHTHLTYATLAVARATEFQQHRNGGMRESWVRLTHTLGRYSSIEMTAYLQTIVVRLYSVEC